MQYRVVPGHLVYAIASLAQLCLQKTASACLRYPQPWNHCKEPPLSSSEAAIELQSKERPQTCKPAACCTHWQGHPQLFASPFQRGYIGGNDRVYLKVVEPYLVRKFPCCDCSSRPLRHVQKEGNMSPQGCHRITRQRYALHIVAIS